MTTDINQKNKHQVWQYWRALEDSRGAELDGVVAQNLSADSVWHGPDPLLDFAGPDNYLATYWQPLLDSFPDLKRRTHILMGGRSSGRIDGKGDGRMWVGGTGVFEGTFEKDYLTIPANGEKVGLRWGEFCCVENGKIVETYILMDYIDLMQQAGCEVLPPSRGVDAMYPPPKANDGIMLDEQDTDVSAHTLHHIRDFIFEGLNSFDQSDLESMGMADYFHPDVKWYGPGGIGACLSFKEFEDNHQQPWLVAFPDRSVQNLDALIGEGPYSGAPGWSGVKGTHSGRYKDCEATGKPIEFNGLDFWKLEDDRYVENWVFVDMIHLFRQFGVDLFARIKRPA